MQGDINIDLREDRVETIFIENNVIVKTDDNNTICCSKFTFEQIEKIYSDACKWFGEKEPEQLKEENLILISKIEELENVIEIKEEQEQSKKEKYSEYEVF